MEARNPEALASRKIKDSIGDLMLHNIDEGGEEKLSINGENNGRRTRSFIIISNSF